MSADSPMSYVRLGRSGLTVSRLCLGTMMFGDRTDEAEAGRIIDDARAQGVNFIDTADSYAGGRSEEIVGRALAKDRKDWVLATKLGNSVGPGPNQGGLSRRWINEEVGNSLKRLGTDFIDVLYLHRQDPQTPMEETIRGLEDVQRAGKVRYVGISNFPAWRVARFCEMCDDMGVARPVVCQPVYHILNRKVEEELLPACAHYGLGVAVYSPLARGLLTGKYKAQAAPDPESRAGRGDKRIMEAEFRPENLAAAEQVVAHAKGRGADPVGFALAWILANRNITSVIAGPRTLTQWQSYAKALETRIDESDETAVDAVVKPGNTAAPQLYDPKFPVEGRCGRFFFRPS